MLTTVDTHPRKLGELALQIGMDLLNGKNVAERTIYDIHLVK